MNIIKKNERKTGSRFYLLYTCSALIAVSFSIKTTITTTFTITYTSIIITNRAIALILTLHCLLINVYI